MQQAKVTVICILNLQDTHARQTNNKLSQALQTKYTTCKQSYITTFDYIQTLDDTNINIFHALCLRNRNPLHKNEIQINPCLYDKYCLCIGKRKNINVEMVRIKHSFVYINRQRLIRLP